MTDKIITYNGVTVVLKRATVRSRLHSGIIYRKFDVGEGTPDEEFSMLFNYVKFLTQATVSGDIGFAVPSYTDKPEHLQAGFEAFLEMPEAFFDAVIMALTRLDDPANETALQPDGHEKKA